MKIQHLFYGLAILMASCAPRPVATSPQPQHPYYLHALSDLRAARWMIEHRPGDWQQTMDEQQAVRRIDAAINEAGGRGQIVILARWVTAILYNGLGR